MILTVLNPAFTVYAQRMVLCFILFRAEHKARFQGMKSHMKTISFSIPRYLRLSLLVSALFYAPLTQADWSDLTEQQQNDYNLITSTLNDLNVSSVTSEDILDETYWIDAENGIDDYDRTGQIDQPWKSITWAMNNVPYDKDTANVVVRAGTYTPSVLYFGEDRGDASKSAPFNLLAFPDEAVKLDGANVADNGALISIANASHISISGFDISNVTGSGKSAVYIHSSEKITITNNEIHHSQWTSDADLVNSPSLSDRLNGIAVVGDSTDITIKNNEIHDLVTGYGEPILVLAPSVATVADNSIHDNDADVFENQQYFVSADDGNDDTGVGSADRPWKTIHKAMFSIPYAEDNATINIRRGRYEIPNALYFEALRGGSEGKYFTLQAYNDEEVIVDGGALKAAFSAMVSFSSTAYVRIKGLTFTNLSGPKSGIYMEGNSHHIELINNKLHGMTWVDEPSEDPAAPSPSDNLNPIAIIGNNPDSPIDSIVIRGNELYDITPGYSEGIKIVGNVTNFLVEDNNIHDIANIGIVAAGNYTWVKDSSGTLIPADVNHARDGIIRNNKVSNAVSPIANSAGIYLDGAHNVLVEENTSHNNSVGFSVGCEQPGTTEGNVLRNNVAYENTDAGLVVGTVHAGASVTNTTVEFNEFKQNYSKGGWGGELTVQQADGLSVQNNVFVSRSDLKIIAAQAATNLSIDNNLYFGESANAEAAVFDWGGIDKISYVGLSEFQAKTCHDLNSMYQDMGTVEYFKYLSESSADMSDDDLNSHSYRGHGGKKRNHHSRNDKFQGHRKGGLTSAVCESSAIVIADDEASAKGKKGRVKHGHLHSHKHKHLIKKQYREKGGARFIRHTHPHQHDHKHKDSLHSEVN